MLLTKYEFDRIRPLEWTVREFNGGSIYYTPATQTDTQLFWLDFLREIFAKKFASQSAVTSISNFDVTQPVLLKDNLELKLPDVLESCVYYASNKKPPVTFLVNAPKLMVLAVAVFLFILLAAYDIGSEYLWTKRKYGLKII